MNRENQRTVKFGGYGIDIKLAHSGNTEDVFWTGMGNSYVMVHTSDFSDGERFAPWLHPHLGSVAIFSINGIGEICWEVSPSSKKEHMPPDDIEVIDYFGLEPVTGW